MKRVIRTLIGIFALSAFASTVSADNWIMNWEEYSRYSPSGSDTLWDVDAYVERDLYFRLHRRAIFVGSYIASASTQYGMAGTWELDTSLRPIRGIRWFKSPGNVINFQSVDPVYTYMGPIRGKGFGEITISKFWVAGYSHIRTSGRDTNIIITKLDRNLNHLYTKEYDLNGEVDVLYKIYTVNYTAMASTMNPPIINGFAGIGYTTYGERFHNENILFVAGDTNGDIFATCVFETPGRDVGMGLYEIESGKFIAIGYTNFNGGSDTSYSPIVIKFTVTPNGCNILWARVYRVDGYTLVPYDIDRTLYIEGAMYNITGTAVPLSDQTHTKGFVLSIDIDGNLMGGKFYNPSIAGGALTMFEEYVDTTSNEIIVVGAEYDYGFIDQLRRFIGDIDTSSSAPLNIKRNRAIITTLSPSGAIVGTNKYSAYNFDRVDRTLLFAVSKIDDTLLVSAGMYYSSDPPSYDGSYLQYYAIKTTRPSLGNQPNCSGSINIHSSPINVSTIVPSLHVNFVRPSRYLLDLITEDPYYQGCVCGNGGENCEYWYLSFKTTGKGKCGSGSSSASQSSGYYEIYNASGSLVGKGYGEADLKDLPQGIYFLRRGGTIKKVIKIR